MADSDRRSPPHLKETLLEKPASFSFFQAIRLLRYYVQQEQGETGDKYLHDNLRIRPDLSLAFPGTDMVGLKEKRDGDQLQYEITATFLGLYGAASPLPTFYTEELLDDATEDMEVVRDFLDIANYPLYPLLIRAWSKYRLDVKVLDEQDQDYLERLFCLFGLGTQSLRDCVPRSYELLRYIGLFSQWPRSAVGLKTVVGDALRVADVNVEQCLLRKVPIPMDQRCYLGVQGYTLGDDAYVGQEIEDRLGRFRLVVGPMDEEKYHSCLPGSANNKWIAELVGLYVLQPLECELELVMLPDDAQTARLGGDKWSQLGYDTWVFSTPKIDEARARFPLSDNRPDKGEACYDRR